MLELLNSAVPRAVSAAKPLAPLRSVRPSLLDLRFTGDPWVVDHEDGTASLLLDNYRLAHIRTMPFDLPSLNQLVMQLRQAQVRRRFFRHLRALQAGSVGDGPSVAHVSAS